MSSTSGRSLTLTAVMGGSALILLCALVFLLLVPHPTIVRAQREHAVARSKLEAALAASRRQAGELETAVNARLWAGDSQSVTAALLARLVKISETSKVKLAGLRGQKAQDFGDVVELPFAMQLAGPYPAVRGLVASLDGPGTRIAVRSVQIAAADGNTNSVTATVGLSVFAKPAERQGGDDREE